MISKQAMVAFGDELARMTAANKKKLKALGLATAGTGVGAGILAEQAKDDIVSGRMMRKAQAEQQGISHLMN